MSSRHLAKSEGSLVIRSARAYSTTLYCFKGPEYSDLGLSHIQTGFSDIQTKVANIQTLVANIQTPGSDIQTGFRIFRRALEYSDLL